MAKIISFMNNKGGVGKTTTVCAVAHAWAKEGNRILLLDLDSQANLTSIMTNTDQMNYNWDVTIEDVFKSGGKTPLPVLKVNDNIDIVPADLDLCNFDNDTSRITGKEFILKDALAQVCANYDYILIDCPPALGQIAVNALIASDDLVLVTNAEGLSYRGVGMVMELRRSLMENIHIPCNVRIAGIVLNKVERTKLTDVCYNRIVSEVGDLLINPCVRKSTRITEAMTVNADIFEYDATAKGTEDFMAVAKEILRRVNK